MTTLKKKIISIFSYGLSSLAIILVNKIVLSTYKFPSYIFLGYCQIIFTLLIFILIYIFKIVKFSHPVSWVTALKIFPLPILYIGNILFGLGGTKALSLPMFTVLRRLTNVLLLLGESFILKIYPTFGVKLSTMVLVFGAAVSAMFDFKFDLMGYGHVLGNDICTASNGIVLKMKLIKSDLDKYELLFYNTLAVWPIMTVILYFSGDIKKVQAYDRLWDIDFLLLFLTASILGLVLVYTSIECTHYTSPLTTSIVGVTKNIIVTYIGMFVGGDYEFHWANFIGLNISAFGAIMYTQAVFQKPSISKTLPNPISVTVSKS